MLLLLTQISGCYQKRLHFSTAKPPAPSTMRPIVGVTTMADRTLWFKPPGEIHRTASEQFVVKGTIDGAPYQIGVSEVKRLWFEDKRRDPGSTVASVIMTAGMIVSLMAIMGSDPPADP